MLARTQIFGLADAQEFAAQMARLRAEPCTPDLAQRAFLQIIAAYPDRRMTDEKGYTAQLFKVLMSYPAAFVRLIMDPTRGIASQTTFFPSIGDVSKRLKTMQDDLDRLESRALSEIGRQAKYYRAPPHVPRTPEEQARITALIKDKLGYLPAAPVDRPSNPPAYGRIDAEPQKEQ